MSGKKQTREEFIGEIMDGTLNYFKVDTKDYSIRVDGDTAHMKVTHTLIARGTSFLFSKQLLTNLSPMSILAVRFFAGFFSSSFNL